jgi:hypothetical protein
MSKNLPLPLKGKKNADVNGFEPLSRLNGTSKFVKN